MSNFAIGLRMDIWGEFNIFNMGKLVNNRIGLYFSGSGGMPGEGEEMVGDRYGDGLPSDHHSPFHCDF